MNKYSSISLKDVVEKARDEEAALAEKVYIDEDGWMHLNLSYDYNFDMARCDTPAKLISWLRHLNEKTWMTLEATDRLIYLACKHHKFDIPDSV